MEFDASLRMNAMSVDARIIDGRQQADVAAW